MGLFAGNPHDRWLVIMPEGPQAEIGVEFVEMFPAGCFTLPVIQEGRWVDLELMGNEGQHVLGRHFRRTEYAARVAQVGEMDGKAEPVCIPASLPDQRQIFH